MSKLRRLLSYSPSEIFCLVFFSALLFWADILIHLLPREKTLSLFKTKSVVPARVWKADAPALRKWIRLVEAADRNFGAKPSCLRRALVLSWISRWTGFPAELTIGIRREKELLEAHAWLESNGEVLESGPEASSYTPFPKISQKS